MACDKCGAKKGHMGGCSNDKNNKTTVSHPRNLKPPTGKKEAGYEIVDCPTCKGTGRRGMRPCQLCGGRGRIRAHK